MEVHTADRPRDSLWMSLLAAGAFVCWGIYANWEYGVATRIQVALTQGFLGLTATFFSAEIVVWLVRKFRSFAHPVLAAGFTSWAAIYSVVWAVHAIAGTPEILKTTLPGMISGICFSFGYAKRVVAYFSRIA